MDGENERAKIHIIHFGADRMKLVVLIRILPLQRAGC